MRRLLGLTLLFPSVSSVFLPAIGFAQSGASQAQEAPRSVPPAPMKPGLQVGARLSYSLPMGTLASSATHLSDLETASVPIGVDAGYRFNKQVYIGGTIAWGAGVSPNSKDTCPSPDDCFRQNAELLIDARLYLAPDAKVGWWLAAGAGWEVAAFSQSAGSRSATATFTGPVLANFQIGFDSRNGLLGLGPYFGMAFGEFLSQGINPSVAPVSTWIPNPGVHTWISLGVRGSYGPW